MPAVWYRHALAQAAPLRAAFLAGSLGDADLLLAPCFPQGVPDRDAVTTSSPPSTRARWPRCIAITPTSISWACRRWCCRWAWTPGRPSAAQLIGAPGSEARMLAFARQFALPHSTFLQR